MSTQQVRKSSLCFENLCQFNSHVLVFILVYTTNTNSLNVICINLQYKAALAQEFTEKIVPQFANGTLRSIVDSVFLMEEVQLAHKRMEANENIGKIVIQISSKEEASDGENKSEL